MYENKDGKEIIYHDKLAGEAALERFGLKNDKEGITKLIEEFQKKVDEGKLNLTTFMQTQYAVEFVGPNGNTLFKSYLKQ